MSSVAPHYAPVQPPSPADIDGAELDHSLREFAADQSESDGPKRTKPLRSTSTDEVAEVLACDSDAVPSVFYSEQRWIGALLSTANGGSSVMCYILQAACVGQCVFAWLAFAPGFAEAAGMPGVNSLLFTQAAVEGGSWVVLFLLINSARDVLRTGGTLEQLRVGQVMISEQDNASLSRWRVGLLVLSGVWAAWGGLLVYLFHPMRADDDEVYVFPLGVRMYGWTSAVLFCTILPLATIGWQHSMRIASCLCRDEVIEVIRKVRTVDPTSDEWEEGVSQPALGLIDKMKLLSDGWSGGLVGLSLFIFLYALCFFAVAINEPVCNGLEAVGGMPPGFYRQINLVLTALWTVPPFLIAMDIAATSTWCDTLMNELNDARSNHGPESHLKIQWLETTLRQLVRHASPPPFL